MFKLSVSFYEVYNDKVFDLLQINKWWDKTLKSEVQEPKELKIREEESGFVL